MVRTRDFLLFLLSVAFLMLAITYTVVSDTDSSSTTFTPLTMVADEPSSRKVTVVGEDVLDREARIASMREQILTQDPTPVPVVVDEGEEETEDVSDEDGEPLETELGTTTTVAEIQLCSSYAPSTVVWPRSDIKTAEREGRRVVYTESVMPTPSTSTTTQPTVQENILLTLPVRQQSLGQQNCLPSDVVGVALDGSLIRNSDYTAYTVFEKYTLIGYALDGYPIYGTAPNTETDVCGGVVVGTEYRYYLSPERASMIACFSAPPVAL